MGVSLYKIVILLSQVLHHCSTQDFPELKFCSKQEIATELRFGRLVHEQNTADGREYACDLKFTDLRETGSDEFVVFTGSEKDIDRNDNNCFSRNLETISGFEKFCPGDEEVVVAKVKSSTAYISTDVSNPSFEMNFYNPAVNCRQQYTPVEVAISGVISSKRPGRMAPDNFCTMTMAGLPPGAALRFALLGSGSFNNIDELDIKIEESSYKVDDTSGVIVENADSEGRMDIVITNRIAPLKFMFRYDVIRCGDIPEIERATHSDIETPYLPGSTVKYECEENYQLKQPSSNTITCERFEDEASWDNEVKCIPVPQCLEDIEPLPHTNQVIYVDGRIIAISCEEGYKSADGTVLAAATCSSPDPDNIPWTWNEVNPNFRCEQAECDLAEIINTTNGILLTNQLAYNMGDSIDYQCNSGYSKISQERITCLSNLTWSLEPQCVRSNETEAKTGGLSAQQKIVIPAASVGAVIAVVIVCVIVVMVCRRRRQRPQSDESGYDAEDVNEVKVKSELSQSEQSVKARPTAPSEYDAVYSDPDNSPSYVNHTVSSLKQSSIDDGHAYENTSVTASADNPDNLSDNSDADDEYEMIATREVPDHIYTKLNKQ